MIQETTENWIPLCYSLLLSNLQKEFKMTQLVDLISGRPAKILEVYPIKGCIAKNSDADLVIFDPMKSQSIPQKFNTFFKSG